MSVYSSLLQKEAAIRDLLQVSLYGYELVSYMETNRIGVSWQNNKLTMKFTYE